MPMAKFPGFAAGKVRLIPIPGPFFSELLPQIDNLDELKLTLFAFWWLEHREGHFRWFRLEDLLEEESLLTALSGLSERVVANALERAVSRGTFLRAELRSGADTQAFYFLNSPRGRAAVQAIQRGEWRPTEDEIFQPHVPAEERNIFQLYEEHVGPLTPMIAEVLQEAEAIYPASWIAEAFRIAVENNVRRWRYIEAILKSWQEEGRDERRNRADSQEDRQRYTRGRFSEFIEH